MKINNPKQGKSICFMVVKYLMESVLSLSSVVRSFGSCLYVVHNYMSWVGIPLLKLYQMKSITSR